VCVQKLQTDAGAVMEQRRAMLDLELVLEASINDEDLARARADAAATLDDRDQRFMRLFQAFQLQKTHLARSLADLRAGQKEKEALEEDTRKLRKRILELEVRAGSRTLLET
jgi:hypothetical protein